MANPSQTFSSQRILKYLKSVDRNVSTQTLYNYLDHIQTSLIVSKAQRYDILTTLDKYYLTDLGLGRIHNSGFKLEMGALLENVVYNELINRGYDVYVGKIPNEKVDFVPLKDGKIHAFSFTVSALLIIMKIQKPDICLNDT